MNPASPIEGGLAANSCVDLSVPRIGDGIYAFTVNIVDLEIELTSSCGLQCERTTNTPTPVEPPGGGGGAGGVLIPVTGADFVVDTSLLQVTFQNLGFGVLSIGLMLHGISLRMEDDEEEAE